MTPPVAPYVCAVCRAPVVAGSRFCAQCGTPFSERPPLRVAPAVSPSTPGAAVPPPGRVPVMPPPPSYGPPPHAPAPTVYAPPPEEKGNALLWVLGIVVLFVAALVGAYVLFAEPVDRDADDSVVTEAPPPDLRETLPPVSADESLDDGSFPTDEEIDVMQDEGLDESTIEDETGEPLDDAVIEELPEEEPTDAPPPSEPEPAPEPRAAVDSPPLAAAWRTYQGSLAQYRQAVRRAGSSDKSQAEVGAACNALFDAGNAVLRLPGRERYAGQITRDRRDC